MEKKPVGRPKKFNAVKSGELKKDQCRFTFITTLKIVDEIKIQAKKEDLKIKDYVEKILLFYWNAKKPKNKDEEYLKVFLKQRMNLKKIKIN